MILIFTFLQLSPFIPRHPGTFLVETCLALLMRMKSEPEIAGKVACTTSGTPLQPDSSVMSCNRSKHAEISSAVGESKGMRRLTPWLCTRSVTNSTPQSAVAGKRGSAELPCGEDQCCDGLICPFHPLCGPAEPLPADWARVACKESLVRSCRPELESLYHTPSVPCKQSVCTTLIFLAMT